MTETVAGQGRPMRVLMVGAFPSDPARIDGGVGAVIVYLCKALHARRDIQLHGVRVGATESRATTAASYPFPVFDIRSRPFGALTGYRSQRLEFRSLLRELQPDVVHGQGCDLPGSLAVGSDAPSVVTVHGVIGEDARYKTRWRDRTRSALISRQLEQPTVRRARHLIAISPYVRKYYGGSITGTIHDVANPVSQPYYEVTRRPEAGRILFAGRVIPRKGVLELVQAFGRMEARGARLIVAGSLADGDYVERIRREALALGCESRVEFKGVLDEESLMREFAVAQILALPSFQETAPMVIQQAMAAAIPVVASRICGIPDQVQHEVSGLLVEPGDVAGLQRSLERLIADPELAARQGLAARARANRHYHASAVAEQTVDVYRSMLAQP